MGKVKVVVKEEYAELYTPYSKLFVTEIKSIGGAKWKAEKSCWTIPTDALDIAKEIMMRIYGEDGDKKQPTLTVRITLEKAQYGEYCGSYTLLGKTVARALGRDSGAKIGEDVIFEVGKPTSGGSAKNWYAVVPMGSIIRLSNVSITLWEEFQAQDHEGIIAEVVADKIDKQALEAEKEKLLKRLAEIEKLLSDS